MKQKQECPIILTTTHLEFLERMKEVHALPDVSKVVRILVSFAMAKPDLETEIFEVIRCASPKECDSAG